MGKLYLYLSVLIPVQCLDITTGTYPGAVPGGPKNGLFEYLCNLCREYLISPTS